MSTAVKEAKKSKFFESNEDAADLALAKSRVNGEFTSAEEYRIFLNKLINESHNREKSL